MIFNRAIVRPPSTSYPSGMTTASLGDPDLDLALKQHSAYCDVLEDCGLALTKLEPDPLYPDSTFVEDTAVLTERSAVLAYPGVASRRGEVFGIEPVVNQFFINVKSIQSPGTLDGGDICQAGSHFFIGISERTNEEGAKQLANILNQDGYTSSFVNIRKFTELLHLKSGIAYLGDQRLVLVEPLAELDTFLGYEIIPVVRDESYAANCVRVNEYILIAAGFPILEGQLTKLGYEVISLEISEFQKMDGGISCLSLRF
jgi:dimethylargininase